MESKRTERKPRPQRPERKPRPQPPLPPAITMEELNRAIEQIPPPPPPVKRFDLAPGDGVDESETQDPTWLQ